jgi:hypothetical protein
MELLLIAGIIALLRWVAGKMSEDPAAEEVANLPPPVPPPRPRRLRVRAPRLPEEPAPVLPSLAQTRAALPPPGATITAMHSPLRPKSSHAVDFATIEALRRAVIAREVLGKPLSLRGR